MPRHIATLPDDLPATRAKKGVSVEQIAEATKINPRYLCAIERGDFRKLPAAVYALAYVRQYARAIGYDEEELVTWYREMAPPEENPPIVPVGPEPWSDRLLDRLRSLLALSVRPAVSR
jgi:cytoskeleton protein RodZ